jgi:hypothetical protein
MSLARDDLDRRLRLEVEGYFKGQEPTSIELARAPLVEQWRGDVAHRPYVTGHPERADGELVTTTRLVWLDCNGKWARTKQRLYRRGDRSNPAEDP